MRSRGIRLEQARESLGYQEIVVIVSSVHLCLTHPISCCRPAELGTGSLDAGTAGNDRVVWDGQGQMGLAASGTEAIAQHPISRVAARLPEMGQKLRPGHSAAWGWSACSVRAAAGAEPQNNSHCVGWQDAEAICASLAGGALLQNGQMTAEIQEEVALTNLGSGSGASKRHSATDKMHFPRSNLQTITTLGTLGQPGPPPAGKPVPEASPACPRQRTGSAGCRGPRSPRAGSNAAACPRPCLPFQAGASLVKCSWPRPKVQRMLRVKCWCW